MSACDDRPQGSIPNLVSLYGLENILNFIREEGTTLMKKVFILLAVLLFCLPLTAGAQGMGHTFAQATPDAATDLPEKQAVQTATDLLMQQTDVIRPAQSEAGLYNFPKWESYRFPLITISHFVQTEVSGTAAKVWVVCFFEGDSEGEASTFVGAVSVASPSGEVLESAFGSVDALFALWQPEKGSYTVWSEEDQYWFDLFTSPPGIGLIAVLPTQGDLSREEARTLGLKAIADEAGKTSESLAKKYAVFTKLCLNDPADPASRVWLIALLEKDTSPDQFQYRYHVLISATDGTVIQVMDYAKGVG